MHTYMHTYIHMEETLAHHAYSHAKVSNFVCMYVRKVIHTHTYIHTYGGDARMCVCSEVCVVWVHHAQKQTNKQTNSVYVCMSQFHEYTYVVSIVR